MNRYFSADLHFGHRKVAELRGFDDVDVHDAHIIKTWNSVVKPSDIVYILGDLTIGNWNVALEKAGRLNGIKRLVSGNHDATWPLNKAWRKHLGPTLNVFESVTVWEQTTINGTKFLMSHLPYKEDFEHDDRYMHVRLQSDMPLLCGHVHGKWQKNGRMLNVGWDVFGRPVSEGEIVKLFQGG